VSQRWFRPLRHGSWGLTYSGAGFSCDNRALPGYCEATGAHLLHHCGVRHRGLAGDEQCRAFRVSCNLHPSKIYRDQDQEYRAWTTR
jgi:hypothetical protein